MVDAEGGLLAFCLFFTLQDCLCNIIFRCQKYSLQQTPWTCIPGHSFYIYIFFLIYLKNQSFGRVGKGGWANMIPLTT